MPDRILTSHAGSLPRPDLTCVPAKAMLRRPQRAMRTDEKNFSCMLVL
jgi:hypothetical protein